MFLLRLSVVVGKCRGVNLYLYNTNIDTTPFNKCMNAIVNYLLRKSPGHHVMYLEKINIQHIKNNFRIPNIQQCPSLTDPYSMVVKNQVLDH